MQTITPSPRRWLEWAREIQALAQTGANYALNDFQTQRYQRLTQIAAEIIAEHATLPAPDLTEMFAAQRGYATPKVDVRAAVFRPDGALLLVREISDGGWTLPGGWADVGDYPAQAAERETWEESGYRAQARRLIGVYDANRTGAPLEVFHAFKLVFLCDLIDGDARPSEETSAVQFFAAHEIPAPLSESRTPPRVLADCFATFADPLRPTVFD